MAGYFVTGTDTGVGKTLVSCALLHRLAQTGLSVIGMKPVAAGCVETDRGFVNDDVAELTAASSVQAPAEWVNPYLFRAPIAPHIAAAEDGRVIDLARIRVAFEQLSRLADAVVVEGAGGFCVPLTDEQDTADLAEMLGLPVILVVGMRLGCLNHSLLTQQAILRRGLHLTGWIANCITAEMPRLDANIDALRERIGAPLLATVPFMGNPDGGTVAFHLLPAQRIGPLSRFL